MVAVTALQSQSWPLKANAPTVIRILRTILLSVVLVLTARADLLADWADADVGSPGAPGSCDPVTDVYTVHGAGTGLFNSVDKFNFLSQQTSGDIEITVQVASLDNGAAAAADSENAAYSQAGVTIRDSTGDAGAENATLYVSAEDGLNFTFRDETGGMTTETLGPVDQTAPVWLRLTKTGNIISGYMSTDGSIWTLVGTATLDLSPLYYTGMIVSSAVDGTLATATFSNVTLVTNLPSGISGLNLWLRADQGVNATAWVDTTITPLPASSNYVDLWMDQSGVGNDATPVDTTALDTPADIATHRHLQAQLISNALNGKPVLHFYPISGGTINGPILKIQDSASLKPTQFTIFVVGEYTHWGQANAPFVMKQASGGTGGYALSRNGGSTDGTGNTSGSIRTFVNNNTTPYVASTYAIGTYGIFQSSYDLQNVSLSLNGGALSNKSYTGAISNDTSLFCIGGQANGGSLQPLSGDIAEILFYNRALSVAEYTTVQAYLTGKYGLGVQPKVLEPTLTSDTPTSAVYASGQKIGINPIPGAVIRYNINSSSDPDSSSPIYLGPIDAAPTDTTYKFKAFRPGYNPSDTLTLAYKYDSTTAFTRNGLALWLRADSSYLSLDSSGSGGVTQWKDISDGSGNGRNGTQSTPANEPIPAVGVHGEGVVRFNGTSDVLNITDSPLLKPSQFTIFVVGNYGNPTVARDQVFLSKATSLSNGYGVFGNNTSPGNAYGYINSFSSNKLGGGLAANTSAVLTLRYDGAQMRTSINGAVSTSPYTTAINNQASVLSLGNTSISGSTKFLQGDIAEVLLFNRALTDDERKEVEDYLYLRYNISNTQPKVNPQSSDLSVAPGLYRATQQVTIAVPPGMTATYTIDGTPPVPASDPSPNGITYSSGTLISINGAHPLEVVYSRANYANSDVISFVYTIDITLPFNPTGIKLWLKADTGVTASGGKVSAWADQSGSSSPHNAVQPSPTPQPLLVSSIAGLKSQSAIRFNGTTNFLSVADHADLKPAQMTLFVVGSYQTLSGTTERVFLSKSPNGLGNNGYGLYHVGTTTSVYVNGDNGQKINQTFSANTYGILSLRYDLQQLRASLTTGTTAPSVSTNSDTNPISYDTSPLYIGSWNGSLQNSCDIAEVLLFDHALSDQQRVTVEKYLEGKYGIGVDPTLPAPTLGELSVPPGAYSNVQDIKITVPDGVTAYYTLDGTVPTTSSHLYDGTAIHLNSTTNILKIGYFETGYVPSAPLQVIYNLGTGGGGAPPTTGLMLWLRSDLGVISNNGLVSGWLDQSSHANHVQASATQQPTLVTTGSTLINSLPVIHFDGKTNEMGINDSSLNPTPTLRPSNLSVYVVGRYTKKMGAKLPFLLKVTNTAWSDGYGIYQQNGSVYGFINNNGTNKMGGSVAPGAAGYFGLTYDGSKMNALFNSSIFPSKNYSVSLNNQATASLVLAGDGFSFLNCDMAEVLFYDHALSESEQQNLESYLYIRYLIGTLPQVDAPVVTPDMLTPGIYDTAQATSIKVPSGVTAYYTVDGTDPTTSSHQYTPGALIPISAITILKVKFFKDGFLPSNTLTLNYTIGTVPEFPNNGLQLWLRADRGVSPVGGPVATWDDQSGNGNEAIPNNTLYKPTVVTTGSTFSNGQPVIHFDGTAGSGVGQILKILDSPTLKPPQYTLFVVGRYTSTGSTTAPFVIKANSGSTNGYALARNGNNVRGYVNGTSGGITTGVALAVNTPGLFTSSYDLQNVRFSLNGGTSTLNAYTTAISYETSAPFSPFSIGGNASGSGASLKPLDGDIAEVILFNRILSSNEMLQMQGYFYNRYGLGSSPTIPNPTLPTSQIFTNSFTVTMDGGSLGTIRYTTDTSNPTSSSTAYSSASKPQLSATTTIRAKLFVSGSGWTEPVDGGIVTATYTEDNLPIPDGAVLRLRADTGVTQNVVTTAVGSTVTITTYVASWLDQSGNGLVASPSDVLKQPVLQPVTVNGVSTSSIVFNGTTSNNFLSVPNTASLNPTTMSVYLVGKEHSTGNGTSPYFFMKGPSLTTGGEYGFAMDSTNTYSFYLNSKSSTNKVATTVADGAYFTAQMGYDFYQISLLQNGIPETPTPSSVPINSTTSPLQIGGGASTTNALNGEIVELIMYNRALTIGEQVQLQHYMEGKYQFNASTGLPGGGLTPPSFGGIPPGYTDLHPEVAPNITLSLPSNAVVSPTPGPTPTPTPSPTP